MYVFDDVYSVLCLDIGVYNPQSTFSSCLQSKIIQAKINIHIRSLIIEVELLNSTARKPCGVLDKGLFSQLIMNIVINLLSRLTTVSFRPLPFPVPENRATAIRLRVRHTDTSWLNFPISRMCSYNPIYIL